MSRPSLPSTRRLTRPIQRAFEPEAGPVHHVGETWGGGTTRLPEQILHAAYVRAPFEQVRCEAVAPQGRRWSLDIHSETLSRT